MALADDNTLDQSDKDLNVYGFMMQMVQEKHGDVDADSLDQEAAQLYELFGDVLLSYFEPQLPAEQKAQFDQLIAAEESSDNLMQFLVENISDLEQQILQVLVNFRSDYLADKLSAAQPV